MKRVILFLLFLWVYNGYSQEPIYTQMKSNYQFRGIRTDSLFLLPKYSDTLNANGSIHGSVIRVGNTIFLRDTLLKKWVSVQGVSTDTTSLSNRINSKADTSLLNGVVYFSDTLTYIATKSDLPPPVDTTSLSNRINAKVDSITKVSDSVKYWKNGTAYFAFKDSSGGGNLTLNQVTDFGNTTQNNIIFVDDADLQMDTFSSVLLANNSRLQEGTIDAGYGGNKGIAQICGLGYELKWEGGMLFSMGSSGNTIREARYMFNYIPQDTNDITEGYQVGSRWVLDNGDTYECTDNTIGAAVWVLQPNAFDSTSLSNRIDNKVDSVTKSTDSVRYWKNGSSYFAYKDSAGGQNGRWGNDTATIVLAKVRNVTATTMARGTVVMLNGATGDVASIIRANNKYDSTSARTIGLVKDPIVAGDTGWVVTQGQASKLQLGAYNEGDVLYLDSLDGGLTKNKPYAPYHQVFVCIVERANNGNGLAYVKPQNGQEITELHDVSIVNPINNQVLVYSDTQDLWKNRNVYSIVDTTSLSNRINQKQNLLSNPVTGTGTSGSLVKFNGTSSITNAVDGVDYLSQDLPMQIFPLLGSTATKAYNFVCPYPNNIVQNVGLGNNMYHNLIYIPKQSTITGVRWYQSITGNYTANASLYNGWALYTINFSTGALTLVDSSANDGNLWKGTANTYQSKPFVVPYSAARGFYVLACFYANSAQTTAPQIGGGVQFSTSAPKAFDFTVPNIKLGSTSSTNTYSTAPSVLSGMGQAIQGNIAMFLY